MYGNVRNIFGSTSGLATHVSGNHVSLLHDGAQVFPAMLADIANAQKEILLEMYWFASDRIGTRFAEALRERARAGVRVRIIYDAIGSLEASDAQWDALRADGAEVEEYNPIAPWRRRFKLGVVNHRDHRKMLVVDGRIGYCGGLNIGDQWAPAEEGGEGWRDDALRIEGPAVLQMSLIFYVTWARVFTGQTAHIRDPTRKIARSLDALDAQSLEGTKVRVLANHYFGERRAIRKDKLARLRAARHSIYITNSYFLPDRKIRHALCDAAERGADVQVLLPGLSDVMAVQYAAQKLYPEFLRSGIRIHEWQGSVLHAKTAVIDREWVSVGTYNFDHRSLRYNLEVTVSVEDTVVADRLADRFVADLSSADEVRLEEFQQRPVFTRMLENFFYLFRKML